MGVGLDCRYHTSVMAYHWQLLALEDACVLCFRTKNMASPGRLHNVPSCKVVQRTYGFTSPEAGRITILPHGLSPTQVTGGPHCS